jgi:cytochrome c553
MGNSRRVALTAALLGLAGTFDASAAADIELGKHLSAECVTCHRSAGRVVAGVPQIAGWPEDQFIAVMKAYQEKVRENPVMQTVASRLGTEDIAALAAYFGSIGKSRSRARK